MRRAWRGPAEGRSHGGLSPCWPASPSGAEDRWDSIPCGSGNTLLTIGGWIKGTPSSETEEKMTQDEEIGGHFLGTKECIFEHQHASDDPIQENLPRIGKERAAAHFTGDRGSVTAHGKRRNERNRKAIGGRNHWGAGKPQPGGRRDSPGGLTENRLQQHGGQQEECQEGCGSTHGAGFPQNWRQICLGRRLCWKKRTVVEGPANDGFGRRTPGRFWAGTGACLGARGRCSVCPQ